MLDVAEIPSLPYTVLNSLRIIISYGLKSLLSRITWKGIRS